MFIDFWGILFDYMVLLCYVIMMGIIKIDLYIERKFLKFYIGK